jgi:predicted nucleic acid-binding protein
MRVVADTSEMFSFFNEKSKARELSLSTKLSLQAPKFSLDEINEHKDKIIKSFSLTEPQFVLVKKLLNTVVKFAGEKEYSKLLSEAKEVSPDPDDVDFFALALKSKIPLWSEDKELKKQSRVKVLNTKELSKLLESEKKLESEDK